MTRPTNTVARREQIARALGRVMAHVGYDGASVVEIAREAGLAPGLVHYHFGNKEEILVALVGLLAADAHVRAERAILHAGDDAAGALAAVIDSRLGLGADADRDAVACWVAAGAEAIRRPEVRSAYERAVNEEVELVERCAGRALAATHGSARGARAMAAAVVAAVQGYYVLATVAPGAVPPASAAPHVRALAEAMLRGAPPRRARRAQEVTR